jgi:hypothetical protein
VLLDGIRAPAEVICTERPEVEQKPPEKFGLPPPEIAGEIAE